MIQFKILSLSCLHSLLLLNFQGRNLMLDFCESSREMQWGRMSWLIQASGAGNWRAGYNLFSADSRCPCHHPVWLWVSSCWLSSPWMFLASCDLPLLYFQSADLPWVSACGVPSCPPNLYKAWGKWRHTYLKSIYLRVINQVNKLSNEICSILLTQIYTLWGQIRKIHIKLGVSKISVEYSWI